jgi:DNA uptake protein ComE-like DNA-binding protein
MQAVFVSFCVRSPVQRLRKSGDVIMTPILPPKRSCAPRTRRGRRHEDRGDRPFKRGALDELLRDARRQRRDELYGRLFVTINLNTASRVEILLIPGLNDRMAHEFEEYRPYTSLEQFRREIGKYVPSAEVARLEQYVFVPMSLNKASGEAFMTIPRMTQRMVHEFEEYRPYTSFEQFRREIGKYVDQKEVARFERYLTIE